MSVNKLPHSSIPTLIKVPVASPQKNEPYPFPRECFRIMVEFAEVEFQQQLHKLHGSEKHDHKAVKNMETEMQACQDKQHGITVAWEWLDLDIPCIEFKKMYPEDTTKETVVKDAYECKSMLLNSVLRQSQGFIVRMYEAKPSQETTNLVEGEYGLFAQFLNWSIMALIQIGHYNKKFSVKIILYAFDDHKLGGHAAYVQKFDWIYVHPSILKEQQYSDEQEKALPFPDIFPPKPVPRIQPQIPQPKPVIKDEKQDKVKKQKKKKKKWYCLWMCENCQRPLFPVTNCHYTK